MSEALDQWVVGGGLAIDVAGGFAMLLFGVLVAFIKPNTKTGFAFGLFAFGFGTWMVFGNLQRGQYLQGPLAYDVLWLIPKILMCTGLFALSFLFPRRLQRTESLIALSVAVIMVAVRLAAYGPGWSETNLDTPVPGPFMIALDNIVNTLRHSSWNLFFLVLAWAFIKTKSQTTARSIAIVMIALALYRMQGAGEIIARIAQDGIGSETLLPRVVGLLFGFIPVAVAWLLVLVQSPPDRSRWARDVVLTMLGVVLFGMLLQVWFPDHASDLGFRGLARIVGVGVLGYAILKHRLFDIDVKLRFGIKHSTVAAIFIAAIFILSEAAVAVFGEERQWIGILAGGMLVFGLAPLQRFGERVANTALPDAKPLSERGSDERVQMYLQMARGAWYDGTISRDERRMLDTAQEQLGLTAGQAQKAEREAMDSA